MKLWTINKYLRWTGFRLQIILPIDEFGKIGLKLKWYGWSFIPKRKEENAICNSDVYKIKIIKPEPYKTYYEQRNKTHYKSKQSKSTQT